jgi:ribonuclease D
MDQALNYVKHPPGGIPTVVSSEKALIEAIDKLASSTGHIAIDAERASGYTYTQRAYLLQLKKPGTETFLIDPILEIDYKELKNLINQNAWILHAATQDLPCLSEFELTPNEIFDTELAARLLGLPRVGLAGLLEDRLKITIDKAHSAVNWASRPLKSEWLSYAALDVEFLHSLQDDLTEQLEEQGKYQIALQEFSNLLNFKPNPNKLDAWRATSGMHKIKNNREAAIVREIWQMRDQIARDENLAPHRVARDERIIQLAIDKPKTKEKFLKVFSNKKHDEKHLDLIYDAYLVALGLPESSWPTKPAAARPHPPTKIWKDKHPEKFKSFEDLKYEVSVIADAMLIPVEHLISSDLIKSFIWSQPATNQAELRKWLAANGARDWQIDLVMPTLLNRLT